MKQFILILITFAVASDAVISGYRYPQPQPQRPHPQSIPIGIRPPQPQSNSGVYSAPQASAVPQYSIPAPTPQLAAQPAISLPPAPPAPQEIAAPVVQPQQQYLPPQQQQAFSQPQQFSQQNVQSVQSFAQQQFVSEQLSQPIQSNVAPQQNFQSFQRPQTAIITKDIFIHSAPEDNDFEAGVGPQADLGPVRKNYRIVFIKAPSQNLRSAAAALQRAQAKNEEKTVIYVLSKKPDLTEVHQQLQQNNGEQRVNKPEVYFIKYKTQEEAERAQKEIQAQYDALGGSTHISNEGIAPVTTVGGVSNGALNLGSPLGGTVGGASSYQQGGIQQQSFSQQNFQSQNGVGQAYLPPRALKK